jgi:hypothetical protein
VFSIFENTFKNFAKGEGNSWNFGKRMINSIILDAFGSSAVWDFGNGEICSGKVYSPM